MTDQELSDINDTLEAIRDDIAELSEAINGFNATLKSFSADVPDGSKVIQVRNK